MLVQRNLDCVRLNTLCRSTGRWEEVVAPGGAADRRSGPLMSGTWSERSSEATNAPCSRRWAGRAVTLPRTSSAR